MTSLRIAIIIPHYNDLERLRKCLTALSPQIAGRADVEALVVDNNSTADLSPIQKDFPQIRFVIETEKGAAAARNRGVEETGATYLLFLDSDCIPAPDWLDTATALIEGADSQGLADIVGGRVDTFDETPPPRSGAEAFETVFGFRQRWYIEDKNFSVTANLLTTRAVYQEVGPMLVGPPEDVEWGQRAVAKGYRLAYADHLAVQHPTRQDWPALEKKWRRVQEQLFVQHSSGGRAARLRWMLHALVVLASGFMHLPQVFTSPKLDNFRDRWSAALTLLRLRAVRCRWMMRQAITGS